MTITRVSRLKDHGIYQDFSWPNDLPDFDRFNLIYGWNGTGKTMLSRLFRALELRKPPTLGQVSVRIGKNEVAGSDFTQATLPIHVFNRDLVNESVFPIGGGDVAPIFIVGKESVEKQKEADRLKQERVEADSEWTSARARSREAERALGRYCQDRARVVKDTLRSSGQNPFNNYNKSDFQSQATQVIKNDDATSHCLDDSERDALFFQHRGTLKDKLDEITYRLPDLRALADATSALLTKTVVSAAIQSLKDDSEVADWTRRGLGLHNERHAEKCLFCQQPLPEGRLAALEAHFSAEYEQFMREIDDQIKGLESIRNQASELKLPSRAEFYDDIAAEYETATAALREAVDPAGRFVNSLGEALGDKRAKAFEALSMDASIPEIDADAVEAVNRVIRKHNQASDDFEMRVRSARKRLELDLIAADIDKYKRLQESVQTASSESKKAKQTSNELAGKINKIEEAIIEHRQPAEDLNDDLRKYLGHGELQLAVKDNGYAITRNGEPAQMLSEGEMTAIALLYFLKSLEGRDFDLANGVVVLDDPVSSLDQNAMFAAFAYIRDRTKDAAQLIVLTHNFLFFRLMREWFSHRPVKKKAKLFMLECSCGESGRFSVVKAIDPLLRDFESEYHYLFSRLFRLATDPPAGSLEAYYSAPSIARRIVESFLAFRVPDVAGRGQLWSQIEAINFDPVKRSRIYRFMQIHSHRDAVGDADEDLTVLGESRAVLNDVLDFMRSADKDHVDRMIAKVGVNEQSEDP